MTTNSRLTPATAPRPLLDLTFGELEREFVASGIAAVHARALWRAVHVGLSAEVSGHPEFPAPLRRWISDQVGEGRRFQLELPKEVAGIVSRDGFTRKFLLRLSDGQVVETVLMGYDGRRTACLSTQVGCAMGCVFCATGQMGFVRHLTAGEIVAQVRHARLGVGIAERAGTPAVPGLGSERTGMSAIPGGGLRNLVLMGMGEPLHNYDAVMTALEIISDRGGLNIGPSRITISTVGVVPGILRLAEEQRPYHLAVSLHGATDEERAALVPIGRRWPLAELIGACRTYGSVTGRRIFFEWTLIAGANDSVAQAARLAALIAGIDAHVNLIPLNPTDGFRGSSARPETAKAFQEVLKASGIPSTVRQHRGIDVAAGCGQLRAGVGAVS